MKKLVFGVMSAGCEFSTISEELQGVNCVSCSCAQCIWSGGGGGGKFLWAFFIFDGVFFLFFLVLFLYF